MFVAMVMSLGVMNSFNNDGNNTNIQQVSLSCASNSEGEYNGWAAASAVAGSAASYFYTSAIVTGATGVGAPVAIANGLLGGICTL